KKLDNEKRYIITLSSQDNAEGNLIESVSAHVGRTLVSTPHGQLLLQGRWGHADECRTHELALSCEIPGEYGRPGVGAGVTSIDQRITHRKLSAAIRASL